MKRTALGASLAAVLLLIAGCGGNDGDPNNKDSGAIIGNPQCADIEGETMTEDFEGCEQDGDVQAALGYDDCKDGRALTVAGPVFAYVGEPIIYSPDDGGVDGAGFQKLWNECYGYEDADAGVPVCSELWVVGNTLPADYAGCDQDGMTVGEIGVDCVDGETALFVFENPQTGEDQFFAITGQKVGDATDDSDGGRYATAYADCTG